MWPFSCDAGDCASRSICVGRMTGASAGDDVEKSCASVMIVETQSANAA